MRRSTIFWGAIIILLGVLLLVNNFIEIDIGRFFWPVILILLGLWVLIGVFTAPRTSETEETMIPLEGAGEARVHIGHGAGRLRVSSGAGPDELLSGSFGGGLEQKVKRAGDALDVKLSMRVSGANFAFPWMWGPGHSLDWTVHLNEEIPLSLNLETGASDTRVDLTDLRVTDLRLQTGASSSEISLPAGAGHTKAVIRSGAASIKVRVPDGVAARIKASGGIADIQVNKSRFPRVGGVYQSEDYATAENKVDIDIETGVGSVSVR
jgi:predicted membrane protein